RDCQGLEGTEQGEGGEAHPETDRGDRQDQDPGPERRLAGGGGEEHFRHRAQHGDRSRLTEPSHTTARRGEPGNVGDLNMAKTGKKIEAARKQVEARPYALADAVPLLQKLKYSKFDETVELNIRLGVDPRHADQ